MKTNVKINELIYLGFSILEISRSLMYEFWYGYMKPKYKEKLKLCYMDTDSFILHIKTEDFFKDISHQIFDTSNYATTLNRLLLNGKNGKKLD